ncbi:uncharacterized protein [Nicotiana sylvestris]|uniref:uncharacterized protein n=1 Tax=Nicotiana sylvestris TaxID=4096 RepID=UPI00388CE2DF
MHDFIRADDYELWDITCDGPYVPTKVLEELPFSMAKTSKEYTKADKKVIETNFRAKKILVCGIGPEEYNRISTCDTAKEIWEDLQTSHEGTTQVKQSKIDMLTTEYELFKMRDDESIQNMHTRFTSIINELHSLGETIPRNKLDLQELTIEEMIENLKTYELKRKIDNERREPKKEKNLVLKADNNNSSEEDSDMAYLTKRFQKMGTVKGIGQQWFMDSGCLKHMTGNTMDFLSLKALQGGSVSFGNGKKGYIIGVEKVGKSLTHSIKNVYYVNGLKYNLLSVSQIRDKGNKVEFLSKNKTGPCKFLSSEKTNSERPGPWSAYVKIQDAKVDDYSRFTWTLFLRTKDETVEVFVAFVKKIQVKMESRVACIRSDHGIEFDNVKFDEFCNENGSTHNISAPRTPQQNGAVERKNKTLGEMARTILIDNGIAKNFLAEAVNTACYLIEPKNIKEALKDADCITAIQDELHQFERNNVWHLVPRPPDRTIIGTRWVFRNKLDEHGITTRNKDKLVVQGYNQEEGIDYDKTFALVARMKAIRILIAFASHMEFTLFQMYVKILYGLKQDPRAWYERLSKFLLKNGFKRGKIDNTLFLKKRGRNLLIVQVYVDDIIFGATADFLCEEFAKLMGSKFEMSMMGELNFFLGLQVK